MPSLEEALGRFCKLRQVTSVPHGFLSPPVTGMTIKQLDFDALASEAIVIECGVGHSKAWTIIKKEPGDGKGNLPNRLVIPGHHGTPGRYLFIGVPLEYEK